MFMPRILRICDDDDDIKDRFFVGIKFFHVMIGNFDDLSLFLIGISNEGSLRYGLVRVFTSTKTICPLNSQTISTSL